METLEDFFKNRALFLNLGIIHNQLRFYSKKYNPEDYNLDFLKEKIEPLCYYLDNFFIASSLHFCIYLGGIEEIEPEENMKERIMDMQFYPFDNRFFQEFEECFNHVKSKFCYQMPSKPFRIILIGCYLFTNPLNRRLEANPDNGEDENEEVGEDEEIEPEENSEDEDSDEETINADKTFKFDECVICLTNRPNVLFCNCGHLCLCIECDEVKRLKVCPVCKFENTIKRTV